MSDEKLECPICGQLFSKSVINKHANMCIIGQNDEPDTSECAYQTPKPVIQRSPPLKKCKVGPHGHAVATMSSQLMGCNKPEQLHHKKNSQLEKSKSDLTTSAKKQVSVHLASIFQVKKPATPAPLLTKTLVNMSDSDSNLDQSTQQELGKQNGLEGENKSLVKQNGLDGKNKYEMDVKYKRNDKNEHLPLPELMRPTVLEDYYGQDHVIGENKLLRQLLKSSQIPSIILWGPPGCGKTTLARILAKKSKDEQNARFAQLSATVAGIADVKQVIKIASNELQMYKRKTILFIDEIHRFNKVQQDTFLPHVENGTITLIGATTENPSFQVNNALLSRCRVIVLEKLTVDNIVKIIKRALDTLEIAIIKSKDTADINVGIFIEEQAVLTVANFCDGDARSALNAIQIVHKSHQGKAFSVISIADVKEALQRTHIQYDRAGDEHYHCASALQKSIRGSDVNGAMYWMTRMWEGGEDPLFIARRLVVTASEDVGLADPQALPLAVATFQACQLIGRPECVINLAHCTTYLARAKKSNESYKAMRSAQSCIKEHEGPLPGVPLHLRNATSKLDRELGYGKGYKYSHSKPGHQEFLPKELQGVDFFNGK